jgi:hypothetical protein
MASYLISTSDFNDEVAHYFHQDASSIDDVYRIVNGYFGIDKIDINIDHEIDLHGNVTILRYKKNCIVTREY